MKDQSISNILLLRFSYLSWFLGWNQLNKINCILFFKMRMILYLIWFSFRRIWLNVLLIFFNMLQNLKSRVVTLIHVMLFCQTLPNYIFRASIFALNFVLDLYFSKATVYKWSWDDLVKVIEILNKYSVVLLINLWRVICTCACMHSAHTHTKCQP